MKCPECGKEFSEPILNFHIERCKVKEKSNSKKLYFPIVLFYDIISPKYLSKISGLVKFSIS